MTDSTLATPLARSHPDSGAGRSGLLRLALWLDAVASGVVGLVLLAGSAVLPEWLGIPAGLFWPVGLFFVTYAVVVGLIGTPEVVNRTAVWVIVGLNLMWVVASVAVVVSGWLPLTTLGVVFVLAQALAVLVFADLQYLRLRRARSAAA